VVVYGVRISIHGPDSDWGKDFRLDNHNIQRAMGVEGELCAEQLPRIYLSGAMRSGRNPGGGAEIRGRWSGTEVQAGLSAALISLTLFPRSGGSVNRRAPRHASA